MNLNPARGINESFAGYRKRMRRNNADIAEYLKHGVVDVEVAPSLRKSRKVVSRPRYTHRLTELCTRKNLQRITARQGAK